MHILLPLFSSAVSKEKDFGCNCGHAQPGPVSGLKPDDQPELPTVRKIAQGYQPHT